MPAAPDAAAPAPPLAPHPAARQPADTTAAARAVAAGRLVPDLTAASWPVTRAGVGTAGRGQSGRRQPAGGQYPCAQRSTRFLAALPRAIPPHRMASPLITRAMVLASRWAGAGTAVPPCEST